MRLMNLAAFCFAVASALLLYGLNYDTRRLEANVQAQERAAGKARSDIAILKAERSHLSRPDRIDPLARKIGLLPPRPDQLATAAELSDLALEQPIEAQRGRGMSDGE